MAWHVERFVVAAAALSLICPLEGLIWAVGTLLFGGKWSEAFVTETTRNQLWNFASRINCSSMDSNETNIMTAHSSCVGSLFNQKACTIPDGMFTWINTEHEKLCKCGAIISTGSTNSISFPSFLTKRCEFKSIHTGTQLPNHACSACSACCWMKSMSTSLPAPS